MGHVQGCSGVETDISEQSGKVEWSHAIPPRPGILCEDTMRRAKKPSRGWKVLFEAPGANKSRCVAQGLTQAEARALARRLNEALTEKEGVPRKVPFAVYFALGW
jgi:hypothetical protein